MFLISHNRTIAYVAALVLMVFTVAFIGIFFTPSDPITPVSNAPYPTFEAGAPMALSFPGKHLTVIAGEFANELDAYKAMYAGSFYTGGDRHPLLEVREDGWIVERIQLPNDLLRAIPITQSLREQRVIGRNDWAVTERPALSRWQEETELFKQIYAGLEKVSAAGGKTALVSEVCAVAEFYSLPLRLFRVLQLPGSTQPNDARWTRRLGPSDAILLRLNGRWYTTDRKSVSWQELQQALQEAHALYTKDERDYSLLPERLRPQSLLREEVPPGALLVYAGLLLRDVVDKSGGGTFEALDAYNTLPDDPNVRQAVGVRRASLYARRTLQHWIEMNRQIVIHGVGED